MFWSFFFLDCWFSSRALKKARGDGWAPVRFGVSQLGDFSAKEF